MTSTSLKVTYSGLPDVMYTDFRPDPAPDAHAIFLNHKLAKDLGLGARWLSSKDTLDFFSGNNTPKGYSPIAMAYAGHQFGGFSPSLGDGRAALIGEHVDSGGLRYDLHLKGSGRTPYSRGGDGKASLRAVLKEYIFSESLAALGIPTTRSLAALTTGEVVMRQKSHPGAILVRTAQSHIRVGTFQYARLVKDESALKALADYTIERLYPKFDGTNPYVTLLGRTIENQAKLIAKWMSVGFIHGVMNTDNMAISGETIDFGPCAFMESFRADQVFSSIDRRGRYAWNKQPEMALWNLTRFAESLLPLLDPDDEEKAVEIAQAALAKFSPLFSSRFNRLMLAKLGLGLSDASCAENAEDVLRGAMALLSETQTDFTLFFRGLTKSAQTSDDTMFLELFTDIAPAKAWLKSWLELWQKSCVKQNENLEVMNAHNPIYIPRFDQLETALGAAEQGDLDKITTMLDALTNPYQEQYIYDDLAIPAAQNTPKQTFCET